MSLPGHSAQRGFEVWLQSLKSQKERHLLAQQEVKDTPVFLFIGLFLPPFVATISFSLACESQRVLAKMIS